MRVTTQSGSSIAFHLLLVAVLSLLAISSSLYYGITTGNDFRQHFQFAQTIHDSLLSGDIYPSFSSEPNGGLGDVGLRFYPPLTYYVLSGFSFICGDWFSAAMATFVIILFAGGAGLYLWAREGLSPTHALLAAAIYTFAPYHINLIYNGALLAEFAATAILPFCFYFVTRVCRQGSMLNVIGLAFSYSILVLTHLPSTIIVSICLAIYAILLLERRTVIATLSKLAAAVIVAVISSSFYWVRMLTEINWLKHSESTYFSGSFSYRANFLFAPQNILNFGDDLLNLWVADLMLLAAILVTVPSLILFLRRRIPLSRFMIAIGSIFIFGIFMATHLSSFVWDNLFFLQKVQFPWRWMDVISASGAIFASIALIHLSESLKNSTLTSIGVGIAMAFFVFTSAFLIKGAVYMPRSEFLSQMQSLSRSDSYIGWWPIWAKESARGITEKVAAVERKTEITEWSPTMRKFIIDAGSPGEAHVRTFYYPHWRATVNGSETTVSADEDGLISFKLPSDQANVSLQFVEPAFVRLANYASISTWIALMILLVFGLLKRQRIQDNTIADI